MGRLILAFELSLVNNIDDETKLEENSVKEIAAMRALKVAHYSKNRMQKLRRWIQLDPYKDCWRKEALAEDAKIGNVKMYLQDRMEIVPKKQFEEAKKIMYNERKALYDEEKALIKEVIKIPEEVKKTPKVEEIPEAIKSNNIDEISKRETSDKLMKVPEERRFDPIIMEMNNIEIENKYITNLKQNITSEHKHEPPDDLSNSGHDKEVQLDRMRKHLSI